MVEPTLRATHLESLAQIGESANELADELDVQIGRQLAEHLLFRFGVRVGD